MNLQDQHERYAVSPEWRAGYESGQFFEAHLCELLALSRAYVADSLEAHEHSDGRELLEAIDIAIAAGTHSAETSETSAPSEGCQSGPKGIAPMTVPPNHPRST